MPRHVLHLAALALLLSGCGLSFRKTSLNTSVSVNNSSSQDIATLRRSEYELMGQATGQMASRQVFVLWFPVGAQKSRAELIENAYYKAAETVPGCDALLLPRTQTNTVFVPLLLVNVLSRRVTLQGRCLHLLENDRLEGVLSDPLP